MYKECNYQEHESRTTYYQLSANLVSDAGVIPKQKSASDFPIQYQRRPPSPMNDYIQTTLPIAFNVVLYLLQPPDSNVTSRVRSVNDPDAIYLGSCRPVS